MRIRASLRRVAVVAGLIVATFCDRAYSDPYPPYWGSSAVHFAPVAWPSEPADVRQCGSTCGEWLPYTRFQSGIDDPRTQDPSNGGTAPQNYVNISSSCVDKSFPSIYYALRQGAAADGSQDVILFRWRVEQIANTYATGPSAGTFGASDPWNSALWSVLFDTNGDGYLDLAAHLDGSSGSPSASVDRIAGIWSKLPTQSLDYLGDPTNVVLIAHNPTAFVDTATKKIMNFQGSVTPVASWPNGASETTWDYGTTRSRVVTSSPCNEYFIDYQIPVALLDASTLGGPKITRSTPISMLFCTANSLNNPFQKDCALNKAWVGASGKPAPFGDYISFNQPAPYAQPIVSAVSATAPTTCPGSYSLAATVQDTLAVVNGSVVPSVKGVSFYYYYDANGNGLADDGNAWTFAATAALKSGTLNTWLASWDAGTLPRGQYLIGVQALDDNTLVDDGATPSGIDNRTFSYVAGDAQNRIYVNGQSYAIVPAHSPPITPSASENWWGNPSVTGNQTALVGLALNTCGVAPSLAKTASASNVVIGGTVDFTLTVTNSLSGAITLTEIDDALPQGFTYASTLGGTLTPTSTPSSGASGTLSWGFAPATLLSGSSATLQFRATAPTTSGNYSNTATANTSFGTLTSAPVAVAVDSARLSLSKQPSTYNIAPDGTTALVYTLAYSNDSTVAVSSAIVADLLPSGVTYVSCSGGTSCANSGGTVTWTIGALAGGASGTLSLTVTVDSDYATSSLTNSATFSAVDPAGNAASASATSTVAVSVPSATSPAFTLSKSGSAIQVAPGATVTWTMAYRNYGTGAATGVVVTDTLPTGFTFSSCSGGSSCGNVGGTVTWNLGSVGAGGSGTVSVVATSANPFTATNPASNTASLNWTENTGAAVTASTQTGVTGNACSTYYFRQATTDVGGGVGTKDIATQAASAPTGSGATTLVSVLANSGGYKTALEFYTDPTTANAVNFNGAITSYIYVDRANGPGLNVRTEVFDFDTGTGTLTAIGTASAITMNGSTKGLVRDSGGNPPSFTATGTWQKGHRLLFRYSVESANTQTYNIYFQYDGSAVSNPISGGTTNAPSNGQFCVTPPANLALTKSVDKASVTAGSATPVQYTLAFSNTGQTKATGVQVIDTLPAGVSFVSATLNGVTATPVQSGQQLTFSGVNSSSDATAGEVSGGTSGTLLINGTVSASASGTLNNVASISSTQTSAVNASASTVVNGGAGSGTPALAIGLAADRTTANPGDVVTYTVTVVNTGTAAANSVQLGDALPLAAYYDYGSCSGGCTYATGALSWNVGTLAPGASATYTFSMLVGTSGLPAGVTVIPDNATASATSVSTVASNTVNVTLDGNPTLTFSKTASPSSGLSPGDSIGYTLTVANDGSADASGVVVTDPIPSNATFAGGITATLGTGNFDAVNNRVVFDVGTLPSGASATLGFSATVAALPAGTTVIDNVASADAANAQSRTASFDVDASAAPVLTLAKRAPAQIAYPLATLTQAANGTTLFVNDTSQVLLGQTVAVGGTAVSVTAVTGNTIDVSASVTASAGTGVIGAVTYALTYANVGTAIAVNAALTDTLPSGAAFVSASDAGSASGGIVTWHVGDLAPGASGTVQVTLIPGAAGTVVNAATITCASCNTPAANVSTSAGGLRVSKRTSTAIATAGGSATYVIEVENTSGSALAGVGVTDTLAPGFSFASTSSIVNDGVPATAASAPSFGDTELVWSPFTLQPGTKLTLTFVAAIDATVGAATYQNDAGAIPAASTVAFDPLSTTAEDVTVLAAGTGLLQGTIYQDNNNDGSFEADIDTPLTGVEIDITDATDTPYVVTTDPSGHFSRVVAAGTAQVTVASADIPAGLTLGAGFSDPASVAVPSGSSANQDMAYVPAGAIADLAVAKSHSGHFAQGQLGASYLITVSNVGAGSTVGTVTVTDMLPTGLIATGMSGSGWSCTLASLTCSRGDALASTASYPDIALTVNVAADAAASVTNAVSVSGGGETVTDNDTASDPTTIDMTGVPDLVIVKAHTGNFAQGQAGATYTLTVSNAGSASTSGAVTVTDTLPTGMSATAVSGAGWVCTLTPLTCSRSDALANGASYPAITLVVTVAADAAATLTNVAGVSGGGEVDTGNDTASDPTTIDAVGSPDVVVAKTHTGNFAQGETGATYALTVSNIGSAATSAPVSVTDTLPTGLSATSIAGPGWSCTLATLTCSRSDALAAGASYADITLTVNVAATAAASLTNTAMVSGGGESNTGNNAASDPTTITVTGVADLVIGKSHSGNFLVGQAGAQYTLVVTNSGSAATAGTVMVTEAVPAGLTATAINGTGWTCTLATTTCTRSDALANGASYPAITLLVDVAADAPASVINTATVSGGGEVHTGNDQATDPTSIDSVGAPDLTIGQTQSGPFTRGQVGASYILAISNVGQAGSSGTVVVTDTLPTGLVATGISGAGWTCTLATLTCTRSDTVAMGEVYPDIVLVVNVAADAPAVLVNIASVSGGGDNSPSNNIASAATTLSSGLVPVPLVGLWAMLILLSALWAAIAIAQRARPGELTRARRA